MKLWRFAHLAMPPVPEPRGAVVKRWRLACAAAALLVLAFHVRLAWPGQALVSNDFRALFIPLRAGLQNTLRGGEWPFWQRGMFLGYPIAGDIQFQLWNPLTWLTLPLDPARGITVQTLCELCLCSVGMVFWMKQRGLRAVESVFAGAAFALCLKQTVHLHHWTFASSTCAWPWMMAGLEGFAAGGDSSQAPAPGATGRSRFLALTALATAGAWIGGSPQMAYFGTGLAFLYAAALRRWELAAALGLGPKGPSMDPQVKRLAMHVEDHPVDYANFEGVIPEREYGGGTVMVWDTGIYGPENTTSVTIAVAKGELKFALLGQKLKGSFVLVRTRDRQWLLMKHRDKYAKEGEDITETQPFSVLSKRTLTEIAEDEGGNVKKAATGDPKKLPRRRGVKRRKKTAKKKVWHSKKRER